MVDPVASGTRAWSSAAWRAEAVAWVDDRLADVRTVRTGDVEQPRVRPWSTQLVVPTDRGRVWLKAAARHLAHEPALVALLAEVVPRRVRTPIAVDADRGWMLTWDEGPRLDEEPVGVETWCELVRDAATLQRATLDAVPRMLATGLPDLRPDRVPAVLDELVHTLAALPPDHPSHLDDAAREQVATALPALREALDLLRASPLPPALQHGDLHPGNAFASRGPGEPWRIFDLGDASVAHPCEVLVVPRRLVADEHGSGAADEVTEAFLEVWEDLAPRADLRTLVPAAARVHAVARAWTWWRATSVLEPEEIGPWGGHARAWLETLTRADEMRHDGAADEGASA